MEQKLSTYFSEVEDPRVIGRCLHLLSDILMVSLLTYLTVGTDYQDMHLFAQERGRDFEGLLQLPNGAPSSDTFERVFKKLKSETLQTCLHSYGKDILDEAVSKVRPPLFAFVIFAKHYYLSAVKKKSKSNGKDSI
jgi:hypothetical protein